MTTADAIAHANTFFKTTPAGARTATLSAVEAQAAAQREKTARLREMRLQAEAASSSRIDRSVSKGRERSRILARA